MLEDHPDKIKDFANVVMIQCVGSRCPDNPNCSRICCQSAVKNALRMLELNPAVRVFVLYRDMRTYGFHEDYYKKAREKGVIFVRYEADDPPEVQAVDEQLEVTFNDPILKRKVSVYSDCLCLSTGFIADEESTEDLGRIFHIPKTMDNYFLEDHIKLRPIDSAGPGIFCGRHGPCTQDHPGVYCPSPGCGRQGPMPVGKRYAESRRRHCTGREREMCGLFDLCSGLSF